MNLDYLINTSVKDVDLVFKTSDQVFSPRSIDQGTLAMLSMVDFQQGDKLLDLGCGYGIVGILAAKILGSQNVVMVDNNSEAVRLSRENAVLNGVEGINIYESDGFKNITEKDFTLILSNPPYHTDFSVPKEFIEKGFNRLSIGGKMFMVTKRDLWYRNKFKSIFGGVRVSQIGGYYVFTAEKRQAAYAKGKK